MNAPAVITKLTVAAAVVAPAPRPRVCPKLRKETQAVAPPQRQPLRSHGAIPKPKGKGKGAH